MAQNTAPIFTLTPEVISSKLDNGTAAPYDMTTGVSASIFTAGASGSYVSKIRIKPSGSTSATVIRIYINSGSATTTTGNNIVYGELSMPAVTLSSTLAQNDFEIPMSLALPANYRLFAAYGTAPGANGGFHITTLGGDY
jgi:hypothetical protein